MNNFDFVPNWLSLCLIIVGFALMNLERDSLGLNRIGFNIGAVLQVFGIACTLINLL
jgi:hypothetical protein